MIRVIDGQITETRLPTTGVINGRFVGNYNLLPVETLLAEGWVDEEPPTVEPTKEQLLAEADAKCEQLINAGFDLDLGCSIKHFGCTIENQANIDNLQKMSELVQQGFELPEGIALEYNTSDDECLHELTFDQILALWVAKNSHVYKYRKACQDEKMAILAE